MLRHVAPLGVTWRILAHAEDIGRVRRLAHGVYVSASAVPQDAEGRHLQVALALQLVLPGAAASHDTAALAWGLDLADEDAAARGPVRFTRPADGGTRSRRGPGFAIATRDLPPQDRAMHPSGLLVTTRDRTAVDVAAEAGLPEALVTLDSAARMNLRERVGRAWLRDEYVKARSLREAVRPLAAAAERGQTQFTRAQLQEALALVDPRRESPAESLSFGHMVLADLPLPELQVRLTDDEGDMYPDFLWREKMLVGEVDGHVKYRTREDLIAERRREARMRALGCRVVRWEAVAIRATPLKVMRMVESGLA